MDVENFILDILALVIVCGFLILFGIGTGWFQCNRAAKELGYNCSYKVMVGCVVEKSDGKKVLLKQMRDYINE